MGQILWAFLSSCLSQVIRVHECNLAVTAMSRSEVFNEVLPISHCLVLARNSGSIFTVFMDNK